MVWRLNRNMGIISTLKNSVIRQKRDSAECRCRLLTASESFVNLAVHFIRMEQLDIVGKHKVHETLVFQEWI